MAIALYPGTFDPPTLGHTNIIERASSLFQKIYIGIAENSRKKNIPCFTATERLELLKKICTPFSNVEVVIIEGLLIDFMKENNVKLILRGIRSGSEFDFEIEKANAHRKMGFETLAMFSEHSISSSLIREIGLYGGRLENFIPPEILKEVENGLKG